MAGGAAAGGDGVNMTAPMRFAQVAHEQISVNRRQPLRTPDAPDTEAFCVIGGVLGLYAMDARSQRQIVALRFPGELLFPGQRGGCGLWPLTPGVVAVASGPELAALEPLRARAALFALAVAHQWLAQCRAMKTVRLAHFLCETAIRGDYGTAQMPNLFTQDQLADITGQTNVNVNRGLAELERQGFIEREPRDAIVFRDWDGLCAFAGFDDGYLQVTP